jgi:hypothetical protein
MVSSAIETVEVRDGEFIDAIQTITGVSGGHGIEPTAAPARGRWSHQIRGPSP